MNTATRRLWVTLLLVGAAACGDDGTGPTDPEDVTFAPSLGIDLAQMTRLESGVYIQTVAEGNGTQQLIAVDWMTADYRLWIPDGTFIGGSPPPLNQPVGEFLSGFAQGVIGMRIGEVRKIVIPSELGYRDRPPDGSGIPVHSVLVFEVILAGIG